MIPTFSACPEEQRAMSAGSKREGHKLTSALHAVEQSGGSPGKLVGDLTAGERALGKPGEQHLPPH